MYEEDDNDETTKPLHGKGNRLDDEGGLHAPPELKGWAKVWWWFHFVVLVNLARFRFIAILIVIGTVIMKWDTLAAYYDKWTRPEDATDAAASDIEYFCPMHPAIVRGNNKEVCPICFMPLAKRKKGQGQQIEALPAGIVNRVQLSPYRVVLAGVQTWPVEYVPLTKDIKAVGFIEFNERGQKTVAARVAGRIDKLYANETGRMVKAGDDLALIYSPELLVTVQNLSDALKRGNKDLADSARVRLKRLGVDDAQIDDFRVSDSGETHLRIRSPISGHVISKYVKEGQYVQEGMPLYDVVDLSTVWIQGQIYEEDLSLLPVGYEHGSQSPQATDIEVMATTRSFPNEPFRGKLAFIYPHVDQDSRTVTVRFELANPDHRLRPGGTAEVAIKTSPKDVPALAAAASDAMSKEMLEQGKVLAVPESAVIDTGSQKIVYRQSAPGVYEGVEVTLGPRMSNPDGAIFYPVLRGVERGDHIVTSGSFLVDAETRLNPAAGSIYFGGTGGTGGSKSASSSVSNVRPSTPDDPDAKIKAALAKLSKEDRALVQAQRFCPILTTNALGSMGPPVKLTIEGQPVFLCCSGCKQKALDNPQETLAKVKALKEKNASSASNSGPVTLPEEKQMATTSPDEEAEIKMNLEKLSGSDRTLAQQQRVCPITVSRLGSMGAPVKVMVDGKPIFLCCEGCKDEALKDTKATLGKVERLKQGEADVLKK